MWSMSITEANKTSQQIQLPKLSVEQLNAIDILVHGKTDQETAQVVGVARETVTRWRNDNPHFAAELNRQRRVVWGASHDKLRALVGKAVTTLEVALDAQDSKVAIEVLKAVGIYGQMDPPSGPEDAELVLWHWARELADVAIRKKAPSGNPTLDLLLRDEQLALLTQQNMKSLLEGISP